MKETTRRAKWQPTAGHHRHTLPPTRLRANFAAAYGTTRMHSHAPVLSLVIVVNAVVFLTSQQKGNTHLAKVTTHGRARSNQQSTHWLQAIMCAMRRPQPRIIAQWLRSQSIARALPWRVTRDRQCGQTDNDSGNGNFGASQSFNLPR